MGNVNNRIFKTWQQLLKTEMLLLHSYGGFIGTDNKGCQETGDCQYLIASEWADERTCNLFEFSPQLICGCHFPGNDGLERLPFLFVHMLRGYKFPDYTPCFPSSVKSSESMPWCRDPASTQRLLCYCAFCFPHSPWGYCRVSVKNILPSKFRFCLSVEDLTLGSLNYQDFVPRSRVVFCRMLCGRSERWFLKNSGALFFCSCGIPRNLGSFELRFPRSISGLLCFWRNKPFSSLILCSDELWPVDSSCLWRCFAIMQFDSYVTYIIYMLDEYLLGVRRSTEKLFGPGFASCEIGNYWAGAIIVKPCL